MLHSRAYAQENAPYGASPTRTPGLARRQGLEKQTQSSSPFKKEGKATSSRIGRAAFSDKTNQSPSPARHAASPSKLGSPSKKAPQTVRRPFVRSDSFVTPAANIGRAGQIKARLGEMHDAQVEQDTQIEAPTALMSEEEMYPEIETMPQGPSAPYVFPPELDGMPSAKEIGQMLASVAWPSDSTPLPVLDTVDVPPLPALDTAQAGEKRAPRPAPGRRVRADKLASQAEAYLRDAPRDVGFEL